MATYAAAIAAAAVVGLQPAPRPGPAFTRAPAPAAAPTHSAGQATHYAAIVMRQAAQAGAVARDALDHWWEKIIVVPRSIELGSSVIPDSTVTVFSSWRTGTRSMTAVVNAVSGMTLTGLPALPATLPGLRGFTFGVTFSMSSSAAASLDSGVTFTFDAGSGFLPVRGPGFTVFPFEPDSPLMEHLAWLTDVIPHVDGSEQRISVRSIPRQSFEMTFRLCDDAVRRRCEAILMDASASPLGVPVWVDAATLTQAAPSGSVDIVVDDPTNADFRVGGSAIVWTAEDAWDVRDVASIGPNYVRLSSGTTLGHAAGARIMPVRRCVVDNGINGRRWRVGAVDRSVTVRVIDNDVDLSSLSGWPTYDGSVLLDGPHLIDGQVQEGFVGTGVMIDQDTGAFDMVSRSGWRAKTTVKTFITQARGTLWAIRRLLHALRGPQVSFWLPDFAPGLKLASAYSSGAASIVVENCGYTRHARARSPMSDVRIVLSSGATWSRRIVSSTETGATETLVLSSSIPASFAPSDVVRIEWLQRVRIAADEVAIKHDDANGYATIGFPVKSVLR